MNYNGIDLPLSALRTKKNTGVGEFFDLLPLISWCKEVGFNIIQLLPLNDSGTDPSPYNALSSCALHPIYISLHALPGVKNLPSPRDNFTEVLSLKLNFLHDYYENGGFELTETEAFRSFVESSPWLMPYCLFKVLRDRLNQTSWNYWPDELKKPDIDLLLEKHQRDVLFYALLQFLAFSQFQHVRAHAKKEGVALKGDIPILISRDSVDCWMRPDLFDFTFSAGAPPDDYNKEGQYWGFPLYNWDKLKGEHFQWWKQRLLVASHIYDFYRIDHVVGLFRIWAIPLDHLPKEGFFLPKNEKAWLPQGREILEMMLTVSPDMHPIAEDLGNVPPIVRRCLTDLKIPGTKVMRWERDYNDHSAFIPPQNYPKLSLTTVSTHDSETLQEWWTSYPADAKQFCLTLKIPYTPNLTPDLRLKVLQAAHSTPSKFHINLLQEYLALIPNLVSSNPLDERINIPGKILPSNWTYRFRPTLEEIIENQSLKNLLNQLIGNAL